jgi:hypothetical protein
MGTENPTQLTDLERTILHIESKHHRAQGSKEKAIIRLTHMSPVAYYQKLNAMLDDPSVYQAAPRLVTTLRARRQDW